MTENSDDELTKWQSMSRSREIIDEIDRMLSEERNDEYDVFRGRLEASRVSSMEVDGHVARESPLQNCETNGNVSHTVKGSKDVCWPYTFTRGQQSRRTVSGFETPTHAPSHVSPRTLSVMDGRNVLELLHKQTDQEKNPLENLPNPRVVPKLNEWSGVRKNANRWTLNALRVRDEKRTRKRRVSMNDCERGSRPNDELFTRQDDWKKRVNRNVTVHDDDSCYSDDDIDWSWIKDMTVLEDERRAAHGNEQVAESLACCSSNSDKFKQQQTNCVANQSLTLLHDDSSTSVHAGDVMDERQEQQAENNSAMLTLPRQRNSLSWTRKSMRRVQPIQLPVNVSDDSSIARHAAVTRVEQNNLLVDMMMSQITGEPTTVTRPVTTPTNRVVVARPQSAPTRLQFPRNYSNPVNLSSSLVSVVQSANSSGSARVPNSSDSSLSVSYDTANATPLRQAVVENVTTTSRPCSESRSSQTINTSTTTTTVRTPRTPSTTPRRSRSRRTTRTTSIDEEQWRHHLSSVFACVSCTLGMFNISRFAILSLHFGGNFIVQFFILSLLIGIPLFTLHMCLGHQLKTGVIGMWKISPIFKGVGLALLLSQALLGLYSVVGVAWMFFYFFDSFITKVDNYKWAESFDFHGNDPNTTHYASRITETLPQYFHLIVLQRMNLVSPDASLGTIKMQIAMYLALVWLVIYGALYKGLRSYEKYLYVFTLVPIVCMFLLCAKLLGLTPQSARTEVFPETSWQEFFNAKSWVAAFQETFLTWGALSACAMQFTAHNKTKHTLHRATAVIVIVTLSILVMNAFLANTCLEIFKYYGYRYLPDSFETINTSVFLRSIHQPLPANLASTPPRYMLHTSLLMGVRISRPHIDRHIESGYQPMRLATEILPATFALVGADQLASFWCILFYLIMILIGIGQLLAIWYTVISGIVAFNRRVLAAWWGHIAFATCLCAFMLGLIVTTEYGIQVVYFLDYCIGGGWWIATLYLLLTGAVFMVRGRPYSGDTVVTAMFAPDSSNCLTQWLGPLLCFLWNVVLPVALCTFSMSTFRNGGYRELYRWHHAPSIDYWRLWVRQVGAAFQLGPLILVPVVAFIQSYRYLNNGPADILERIQLLYRPPMNAEHLEDLTIRTLDSNVTANVDGEFEDPPPKYEPPPSYTTATGARIAKLLRQSFRRSVRRLTRQTDVEAAGNSRDGVENVAEPPPPDYAAVLVEMGGSTTTTPFTARDVANILRSSLRRSLRCTANVLRGGETDPRTQVNSVSTVCLVDSPKAAMTR